MIAIPYLWKISAEQMGLNGKASDFCLRDASQNFSWDTDILTGVFCGSVGITS
jgi:hypothetical protein